MIRIVLYIIQLLCSSGYLLVTIATKNWKQLPIAFCWWVACAQLCSSGFIDEVTIHKKELAHYEL